MIDFLKNNRDKGVEELMRMKEYLQKEYTRLEDMKEEIKRGNWRKMAGEIISEGL